VRGPKWAKFAPENCSSAKLNSAKISFLKVKLEAPPNIATDLGNSVAYVL